MRRSVFAALTAMLLLASAPLALGKDLRGAALVIGESDYDSDQLRDLTNPKNDARAMDELLGNLGFDVDRVLDKGHDKLENSIAEFVDEAKGADVALVYYSGHGIEAGGEDYLVPTDADISTPEKAGESLVALTQLLDALAKTVPVTIVLLDACRTDAFPSGTTIELPGTSKTIDVAATGLGVVRGPAPVAQQGVPDDSLGMVIGFAAGPGQAALDGDAGGNSPYAAALLKHLGAGGYSFADVMTLVSEEVYLKTDARQLPWTNSSLRRVLSFGAAPVAGDADEAAIIDGRRKLLLTIATLPDADRQEVEAAAHDAQVPMDALYGLLEALGQQVPSDPQALAQLLGQQTLRLKAMLDERAALSSSDPEIERLAGLAQKALDEGALDVSINFWEQAKARYAVIEQTLDTTEAELKARRLEGGALLARTAEAYGLAGDYQNAAGNYGQAFDQVAKWDQQTAYAYKLAQADALEQWSEFTGDADRVNASFPLYRQAIELAPDKASMAYANAQNNYGIALQLLGNRQGDLDLLDQAANAFSAALTVWTFTSEPTGWIVAKSNLASLLNVLGTYDTGTERLAQAVQDYRDILAVQRKEDDPFDWAMSQSNFGNALAVLGERTGDSGLLNEAIAAFDKALATLDRSKTPDAWSLTQSNYGSVLSGLNRAGDASMYQRAVDAYKAALEVDTRERAPAAWARDKNNLANLYEASGDRTNDSGKLQDAVDIYHEILEVTSRQDQAEIYGQIEGNLARALNELGDMQTGTTALEQSVAAAQEALSVVSKTQVRDWAKLESLLGNSTAEIGIRRHDKKLTRAGRAELVAAWDAFKAVGDNYDGFYIKRLAEIDKALRGMS